MSRELNGFILLQLQSLFEALAEFHQHLLAIAALGFALLATERLADSSCPETDTVETFANVDDNTHDLTIILIFKVLANSRKHNMEPEGVDIDGLLVLELKRPFATMLVLWVFPLWPHALLEQVVVGLESELGSRGDVVLETN
jgi:hypothetical protein